MDLDRTERRVIGSLMEKRWATPEQYPLSINALVAAGISSGCSADSFCGSDFVTREHMATFMARAFDLPNSNEQPFGDVVENQHTWAIRALAAAGITSGCGNGNFCPDDPVTRAQMASFLIRAIDWE